MPAIACEPKRVAQARPHTEAVHGRRPVSHFAAPIRLRQGAEHARRPFESASVSRSRNFDRRRCRFPCCRLHGLRHTAAEARLHRGAHRHPPRRTLFARAPADTFTQNKRVDGSRRRFVVVENSTCVELRQADLVASPELRSELWLQRCGLPFF
jgi:hypothetical protein